MEEKGWKAFLPKYRIVASSNTSRLEAHAGIYKLLMKGSFDAHVLWLFDKKLIFELVTRIITRDFTVSRWKATKQNILISALQSAWTSSLLEVCKRDTIAAFVFTRYVAQQCYQHHNNERGSKSKTIVTTTWWFQIQVHT